MANPVTNKHNLPQTLVNLANRDRYSRGNSKISTTELIGSPRIRIMRNKHADDIVEDVADRVWALLGSALHEVVERGADNEHLAEERLFHVVNGWRISGGIDLQKVGFNEKTNQQYVALSDYKMTSAWTVMNPKKDWERQLNIYAYLVEVVKGWKVTGLTINAIIRDWNRREAERNPNYPVAPAIVIDIPLWSAEERRDYVHERVRIHQDAERAHEWDEPLPDCTDEERWLRTGKLAVMKEGRARALKLFDVDDRREAEFYAAENKAKIVERPGENIRCMDFCPVSDWCGQWKAIREKDNA